MMNYISYLLWGGPFNAISVGNVKTPSTGKQALKDFGTVIKGILSPLMALLSCSGTNCWYTMDDFSDPNGKIKTYEFKDSPQPIEQNPNGGYIYHGNHVTYRPGERYAGEATEGFVSVLPKVKGNTQTVTFDFDRYYDKPDSIWHVTQELTNDEYDNLIKKYPEYTDPNIRGKVFKLKDFYKALQ